MDGHLVIDESADTDEAIIGAGFTLLRLTSRIDEEGRGLVVDGLRRAAGERAILRAPTKDARRPEPCAGRRGKCRSRQRRNLAEDLHRWGRCAARSMGQGSEQRLSQIEKLRSWWASVDAETKDFCPDPFSLRNYVNITRHGESLVAHAGDRRLRSCHFHQPSHVPAATDREP